MKVGTRESKPTIELDDQSYQDLLRLTIDNLGDLTGLHQIIEETLAAHPDWDEGEDGRQTCIGEKCDWVKGKAHTRDIAWRKHQTYNIAHALKAAGFRRVYDIDSLGGDAVQRA